MQEPAVLTNRKFWILALLVLALMMVIPAFLTSNGIIAWNFMDFVISGLLISTLILSVYFVLRFFKKPSKKWGALLIAMLIILLIWIDLAVGIFSFSWSGS